MNSSEQR